MNYKKFCKLWIMCVLLTLLFGGVLLRFICGPQYMYDYNAAIRDKIDRLRGIESPKIILVGNSNVAFGIHSDIIEKKIKMPVVNLGLHGGLGTRFHENIAKFNVGQGDLVILLHSDYRQESISDYNLAWITVEFDSRLWKLIDFNEYPGMIKAYPTYLTKALKRWILGQGKHEVCDSCYHRYAFNKYGDVYFKPTKEEFNIDEFFKNNLVELPCFDDLFVDRINELCDYVKEKKAYLAIAAYPIAYGKYTKFKLNDIKAFEYRLRNRVRCQVISNFENYLLPYDFFYDTTLHLNEKGAEYRTNLLVEDIIRWKKYMDL